MNYLKIANEVTIVIPTYNRAKYLSRALNSVLSQTMPPRRIVIADNDSKDDTLQVIHDFKKILSNLEYFKHDRNIGPLANWIFVTEIVKTKFCKILWDDDWLEPNCIERMVFLQKKYNADTVLTGAYGHVNGVKYLWYQQEQFSTSSWDEIVPKVAFRSLPNSPLAGLHLTTDVLYALKKFPYSTSAVGPNLVAGPDLVINFLASSENRNLVFTPEPLVNMYGDGQNMTGKYQKQLPLLYQDALRRLCLHNAKKISIKNRLLLRMVTAKKVSVLNFTRKFLQFIK